MKRPEATPRHGRDRAVHLTHRATESLTGRCQTVSLSGFALQQSPESLLEWNQDPAVLHVSADFMHPEKFHVSMSCFGKHWELAGAEPLVLSLDST